MQDPRSERQWILIWKAAYQWLSGECPVPAPEDLADDRLAEVVRDGCRDGLKTEQIVGEVARAMYRDALGRGAGDSDIGLFGPRLYRHAAREFVETELRASRR